MSRCLYRKAEVREITFRFGRPDNLSMTPSVIPSIKYSAVGSPLPFATGSTATEWMGVPGLPPKRNRPATSATTNAKAIAPLINIVRRDHGGLVLSLDVLLPDSTLLFASFRSALTSEAC